jgi:cardiolipin synthase
VETSAARSLIVQPDDGTAPLLNAIAAARSSILLVVFRFDITTIERALYEAVARGVQVRALVAHTNKNGEQKLRELEVRFRQHGVAVARTGDEFVRYHGKLLLVDGVQALILGFNYTWRDVRHSRSLGVTVTDSSIVNELSALVNADAGRGNVRLTQPDLVISPENSRAALSRFIEAARDELLIYDPDVSDNRMIQLLRHRAEAGVRIRLLGKLEKQWRDERWMETRKARLRVHVRAIVRDRESAFVGSQSLRRLELERRREVGILLHDARIAARIAHLFDGDWASAEPPIRESDG